jgi:hypothetical protein
LVLFFEDAKGRRVAEGPAWEARERRFLWEVVHDTRGVLRRGVRAEHLNRIRQVETEPVDPKAAPSEPAPLLEAYEAATAALRELGPRGPAFHWVAPAGSEEWAAVHHFEDGGRAFSLIGGWAPPFLRDASGDMEPLRTFADGQDEVVVGQTRLQIRREPFFECFREDLESLLGALGRAVEQGLRVRFVQV